ncbi:hypothetical protein BDV27DRAFT_130123 [Aspergillus caelatus]|uniref:Uncharacterized protein n=1 Tax=Aspergillus caelatus TaxID=61420 RepID=A0A5N7A469_9EURO|nr:uncharacterized protein BDV27DRAFT_130123 [Aspergillus caelatus]KAE8363310.1 hypothetical protein BDV27DRAFT_130123 [Aspergillus caelatus]
MSVISFLKASNSSVVFGLLCLCCCSGWITTMLGQGINAYQATVQEEGIVSSPSGQVLFIEYSGPLRITASGSGLNSGQRRRPNTQTSHENSARWGTNSKAGISKAGSIHFHSGPVLPVIFCWVKHRRDMRSYLCKPGFCEMTMTDAHINSPDSFLFPGNVSVRNVVTSFVAV